MVAVAVTSRPESVGRICVAVEVVGDATGFTALNVVLFDTIEEAQAYAPGFAGPVVAKPPGTVLQLVPPPGVPDRPVASDPP